MINWRRAQLVIVANLTSLQGTQRSCLTSWLPLRVTRGIERTFPRSFSETFQISKNEDFNGPYLVNENEFLKNSFETVFRASESCDRGQLVSAFQLTFNVRLIDSSKAYTLMKLLWLYKSFHEATREQEIVQ